MYYNIFVNFNSSGEPNINLGELEKRLEISADFKGRPYDEHEGHVNYGVWYEKLTIQKVLQVVENFAKIDVVQSIDIRKQLDK